MLRKVDIFWEGHKILQISTNYLSYILPDKELVEISKNFEAFSEYMNFNYFINYRLGLMKIPSGVPVVFNWNLWIAITRVHGIKIPR